MTLFLKTPGGFWDLGWHSGINNLLDTKQSVDFTATVKDLKVIMKDEVQESNEEKTPAKPIVNKPKIVE